MTLQSKRKTIGLTRFILTLTLLIFASVSAPAQTNTFPPTGNAGVGTTTPWQKLSVLGTAGNREGVSIAGEGNPWVYTDLNLTPISSGIATGKPTNFAWSVRKDAYYGGDSSGPSLVMEISRQGGGVYVPFIINPSGNLLLQSASNATNGNVGIGTLSPAYKLQVGSNIWSNLGANYKLAVDGDLALGSAVPGSNSGLSIFEGTSGYRFNLFKRAGYTEFYDAEGKLYFNANVGVGTAAPNYKLDVQGGQINSSGGLCMAGDCKTAWSQVGGSQWTTSGSNIFYNTGSIGVGVASPRTYAALDINTSNSKSLYTMDSANGGLLIGYQGSTIQARQTNDGNNQNLILQNWGGNVGIGTTSPTHKLVVGSGTISSVNPNFQIVSAGTSQSWVGAAVNNKTMYFGSDGTTFKLDAWDYGTSAPLNLNLGGNGGNLLFPGSGVWKSTGAVGIGTTSPNSTYKLDVNGEINATGIRINGTPISSGSSPWTTGTNSIYYNSGNVGIGTTTPGAKLDIGAGSAARGSYSDLLIGTGGNNAQMEFYGPTKSSAITHDETLGGLVLYTNGPAFSPSMFVGNGGNVGIGTTSPSVKLELANNSAIKLGNAYFSSGGDFVHLANNEWYNGTSWTASAPGALIQISGQDINFYRHDAVGSHTQSLNISSSGYVGIGTASAPSFKLDVQGGQINSSGGLCIAGDCKTAWSQVGGGGSSQWSNGANSTINYNTGNVGIGTTTPDNPLTVKASGSSAHGFAVKNNALTQSLTYIGPRGSGGTAQNQGLVAVMDQGTSTVVLDAAGPSYFTGGNVGIGNSSPTEKLHVTGNITVAGTGNITATGTITGNIINAKYQDLAEWVPSSEQLVAGTVVVLDTTKSNQVVSATVAYDTRVAGVISAQPGITLGEGGEGKVLVATTGRVRVKVDASRGAIQIGDLLVTSDVSGVAMKSEPVEFAGRKMHMPGTIIGKALEPLAKGSGEILVLLSLQ
jgi:hypothetical protein